MSETHGNGTAPPATLAEGLYGKDGPISGGPADPRTRAVIESGFARPDPRFSDEPRPSPVPPARATPAPGSQAFDAARYANEGQLDLGEFSGVARDLNLSQGQAEQLLSLHTKETAAQKAALERTWDSWHQTSRRDLGDRLEPMVSDIRQAIGSDRDAARFYELLTWSGIEHDPATIRVLHRLATGRRW
jgi:hypothetical protein